MDGLLSVKLQEQGIHSLLFFCFSTFFSRFSSESSAKKMTPAEIAIQMKLNAGSSINGASKNQFEVVSRMLEAQEYAKKARLNLWRYGDFEGDDEL